MFVGRYIRKTNHFVNIMVRHFIFIEIENRIYLENIRVD